MKDYNSPAALQLWACGTTRIAPPSSHLHKAAGTAPRFRIAIGLAGFVALSTLYGTSYEREECMRVTNRERVPQTDLTDIYMHQEIFLSSLCP